jgi:hypothetical protein
LDESEFVRAKSRRKASLPPARHAVQLQLLRQRRPAEAGRYKFQGKISGESNGNCDGKFNCAHLKKAGGRYKFNGKSASREIGVPRRWRYGILADTGYQRIGRGTTW